MRSKAQAQRMQYQKKTNDAWTRPTAAPIAARSRPEERLGADLGPLSLAKPTSPAIQHDMEEMQQTIARDLAAAKRKQADLQDELVLTKQLLKNVEKNRLKIT